MVILKNMLVALLGLTAVGAFAVGEIWPGPSDGRAASASAVVSDTSEIVAHAVDLRQVTFEVEGMTCGGCAIATRTVLSRLDGVKKVEVDYEQGEAVVAYDPEKVSVQEMIAAVKELGYTARVVEPEDP